MKNLFILNEDEKERILGLHENATKRHYLNEQSLNLGQPEQPVVGPETLQGTEGTVVKKGLNGDPYVYAKLGNNFYYSKDTENNNPNWVLATKQNAVNAIKSKIFNEKIPETKKITPPKKEDNKKKKDDNSSKKSNIVLSKSINPKFKSILDTSKLSTSQSVPIFNAGQPDCAQFVNDFDDSRSKILNAWTAHDVPAIGNTVWSSFTNLNSDQINKVTDLWKKINKNGGGKENGPFSSEVVNLVNNIVPKTSEVPLKLNDVVGLFYPGSKHHEEAFYNAGKRFFKKNSLGKIVNGDTINKGTGWGMNTHVGIVGAIDNGVPIVFHNIGGQVWADPYNNLKGGSRIAWVKRA